MSKPSTTNVGMSRREMLIGSACMAAAASLPAATMAATAKQQTFPHPLSRGKEGNTARIGTAYLDTNDMFRNLQSPIDLAQETPERSQP